MNEYTAENEIDYNKNEFVFITDLTESIYRETVA